MGIFIINLVHSHLIYAINPCGAWSITRYALLLCCAQELTLVQDIEMTDAEQPEKPAVNDGASVVKEENTNGEAKVETIGKYICKVKNFSKIRENKYYTEPFEILGQKWYTCIHKIPF